LGVPQSASWRRQGGRAIIPKSAAPKLPLSSAIEKFTALCVFFPSIPCPNGSIRAGFTQSCISLRYSELYLLVKKLFIFFRKYLHLKINVSTLQLQPQKGQTKTTYP